MPRYIKRFFTCVCGLLVFGLASCATQRANLAHVELADIHRWNARGKISVTIDGERKNANFSWLNKGKDYDIRLHGPFGTGAANLKKRGDTVAYSDGKHNHLANSAEALLEEATGWILPISELNWWIKALPSPASDILDSRRSPDGQLSYLRQQGWQLNFKDYQQISGHALPGKIIATRDDLKLVLAIKQWELKAP